ncbi:class I adenylate-forming enzyme family protein [Streptococcus thermophilus]|jgi:O-succinylbenzoic acid--CoA ligase|nr:AMP-binding protein [Streptococcus thermophilus]MCE2061225.1 AMP-binding protein [Streptococcus thermophilus]MCE2064477.1 AMP-binding protein [Streptococcus thermophilus]MCE2066240.1 AMP-binding protein [Streptococcus thermophilus]MCE2072987.1 AMP-binding protein [Streptococcus thermophilus]
MNLYEFIFRNVCLETVAIVTDDREITYKELLTLIDEKCKIIPNNYEVLVLPVQNSLNMIVNLFAALKKSKKVIILNPNVDVSCIGLNNTSIILNNDTVTLLEGENLNFKRKSSDLCDLNILTSGTTGNSKLCSLPTRNIADRVTLLYEDFLKNQPRIIEGLIFPVFSITALTIQLFPTLLKGGTLILIEKIEQIPIYLTKYKISFLGLTPTVFKLLCDKNIAVFKNLDNLFLGGEMIDFPTIKAIAKKLKTTNIILGYGLTEGAGVISYGNILEIPENSVGKIINLVDIRIIGNEEIGELEIRNVGEKNWISTGDIAYIKGDYLFIVDRKKSIIISSGKNLYPNSIKNKILTIEGVEDLIVYGIQDSITGEAPAIDVVTTLEYDLFIMQLKRVLKRDEFPKRINFVKSLKINRSGKREVKINEKNN